MHPRVVAISGPLKGHEFPVDSGRIAIGRESSNQIAAPDSAVSRQHCIIEWIEGKPQVTDLESHNGTFVNGIPVSRRVLVHGDILQSRTGRLKKEYHAGKIINALEKTHASFFPVPCKILFDLHNKP